MNVDLNKLKNVIPMMNQHKHMVIYMVIGLIAIMMIIIYVVLTKSISERLCDKDKLEKLINKYLKSKNITVAK
jgi:hypothetical protein